MGSSKKHKDKDREKGRESRKKRRKSSRSRSRSRSRGREIRETQSKRDKHAVKSHRERESRKRLRESPSADDYPYEKVKVKEESTPDRPEYDIRVKEEPRSPSSHEHTEPEAGEEGEIDFSAATGKESSLSITDTNKLRAQLGLKPLEVNTIPGLESGEGSASAATGADGENKEVFVKTENLSEKREAEKIREKLATQREKRKILSKLSKVRTLAEDDSDDDAAKWVEKSRKIQQEKEMAEKRAKLLEEMDKEFGVGALVEEEFKAGSQKAYSSRDLRGLTVAHDHTVFQEGKSVILTLKDKAVLEEGEDVLENVNLLDDEKAAKNAENRLKKPDYRPWDDPEVDEFGIVKKKSVLSKYDEEIEGNKASTFKLGANIQMDREKELELIKLKLKQQGVVTLEMPAPKIASEYLTEGEMVNFKKRRKVKKKVRKRDFLKADDLAPLPTGDDGKVDHGSRIHRKPRRRVREEHDSDIQEVSQDVLQEPEDMDIDPPSNEEPDVIGPEEDLTGVVVDDEAEVELQAVLNKTRKLKQVDNKSVEKVVEAVKRSSEIKVDPDLNENKSSASIVLNSTAEFCRTLGDIPTYGMSGNRDEEADELLEFERELMEEKRRLEEEEVQNRGAWNEVDIDEKPVEIKDRESKPILEEEPDASVGLGGALQLAMKKGYLEKELKKGAGASRTSQLQAQAYTIEEKFYEDDKFGRRERYAGPLTDFREKESYKPDIKLEYIDDSGRLLNPKEAFRYLSHKFHGKGPGKNKIDKRMKKLDQEGKLKQMSSTDTPLGTLRLLQEKQKELQSPYILLSGGQKALAQTSIVKTK